MAQQYKRHSSRRLKTQNRKMQKQKRSERRKCRIENEWLKNYSVGNAGQENSGKNSVVKSVKVKVNQCVVAAILKKYNKHSPEPFVFFSFLHIRWLPFRYTEQQLNCSVSRGASRNYLSAGAKPSIKSFYSVIFDLTCPSNLAFLYTVTLSLSLARNGKHVITYLLLAH